MTDIVIYDQLDYVVKQSASVANVVWNLMALQHCNNNSSLNSSEHKAFVVLLRHLEDSSSLN